MLRARLLIGSGLLAVLMALLMLANPNTGDASGVGYPVSVASGLISSAALGFGLFAVLGADQGWLLRRTRTVELPRRRSLAGVLAPGLLAALLVALLSAGVAFTVRGGWSAQGAIVFAVLVLACVGSYLAGLGLGRVLPRVVSLPLALLPITLFVMFAPAGPPIWLRYLSGYWATCCTQNQQLDLRAPLALLLVSAGLAGLGLVLVGAPILHRWRSVLAALLIFAVGFAGGVQLARRTTGPIGPTVPRSGLTQCVGDPRICLWPENEPARSALAAVIADVLPQWEGLGVPHRFDDSAAVGATGTVPIRMRPTLTDPQSLTYMVASGVASSPCLTTLANVPVDVLDAQDELIAYLVLRATGRPLSGQLSGAVPGNAWTIAQRTIALSPTGQQAWFGQAMQRVRGCS